MIMTFIAENPEDRKTVENPCGWQTPPCGELHCLEKREEGAREKQRHYTPQAKDDSPLVSFIDESIESICLPPSPPHQTTAMRT